MVVIIVARMPGIGCACLRFELKNDIQQAEIHARETFMITGFLRILSSIPFQILKANS